VFIISPNYLGKLRKCIKRIYLVLDTMFFWCSLVMCDMLVKLVLSNYMFATYVNNYFLQMWFLDRSGNLAKFFMIMCFLVKVVYNKVVDNSLS
jgi:hypothetical protein